MSSPTIVRRRGEILVPRALLESVGGAGRFLEGLTLPDPKHEGAVVRGYRIEGETIALLPGTYFHLWRHLETIHGRFAYADERPMFPPVPFGESSAPELFEYQKRALDSLNRNPRGGVLVAPTGAGKSLLLAALVAHHQRDALVLCPTRDICDQLKVALEAATGIETSEAHGASRIVVAPWAAYAKPDASELARFGLVLVDECHHAAAPGLQRVLAACSARTRVGVTATPLRSDGLWPLVEWTFGPVLATVTFGDLEAAGRFVAPRYEQLETAFVPALGANDNQWHGLMSETANDDARNALIVSAVGQAVARGPVLVVVGRPDHGDALAKRLRDAGHRAEALHAKRKNKDRTRVLEEARAGRLDVLVGTQIADEGLDVPCLATVVLAAPSRAEARLVQRVGRVLRPLPGKPQPTVVDVVDNGSNVLKWQAKQRERTFLRVFTGGNHD